MISYFPVTLSQAPIPQPPSPPSPLPLWGCSPIHPSSPAPPNQHPPTLGHQTSRGPRASPPIDVRQGHSLLHMYLEPWIPPCILITCLFSCDLGWSYLLFILSTLSLILHFVCPSIRCHCLGLKVYTKGVLVCQAEGLKVCTKIVSFQPDHTALGFWM